MIRRTCTLVASLVVALAVLVPLSSTPARAVDRDCGDFRSQAAAQNFFLDHGGPNSDPHGLDDDGDGVACESNPCPCNEGTGNGGNDGGDEGTGSNRRWAKIVRVLDGDTVLVKLVAGGKARVRLLGIDAPERRPAECGNLRATQSARTLMPRGSRVLLLADATQRNKDGAGRLLRYVIRNGQDVNRAQVARGWAEVYAPGRDFKRAGAYRTSQRAARNNDRGIWGLC